MPDTNYQDCNPLRYFYLNRQRLSFALIELLIAIAIFAVIVTVIYITLYSGMKAYHKTQVQLIINQEINQVLDKLATELRNCYDAEYNKEDGRGGFIANSENISFFTIQNVYLNDGPGKLLARISYVFRDGKLFKKIQLDKDAFLDAGSFNEEELISDIKEFNFQYFYFKKVFPEGEDKYEWKSEWADKNLIPKGIKIELTRYDPKEGISVSLKRYIFLAQGEIPAQ
ncbi:MAG: prepilin-type N-terminal cleavage/methylation domain-containing protein [Candidatus Omnitrophica bacterium]|nr:prepilin-type N-terminal cleavage/methylation domain-containing protein [Candidatus Omnitrophota bacterium]MDD5351788.1 prepilin-type N-terminal cleavage/methylation domain-containing protein [Candidatus Omnitrophota bacterium]MDD5550614.1 prepilin-type N-terminal cleavage/methylation domain-containing protein [Candidatus Omnitrophota bacterium]